MNPTANILLKYLACLVMMLVMLLLIWMGYKDAEPVLVMLIVAAFGVIGVHISATNLSGTPTVQAAYPLQPFPNPQPLPAPAAPLAPAPVPAQQ